MSTMQKKQKKVDFYSLTESLTDLQLSTLMKVGAEEMCRRAHQNKNYNSFYGENSYKNNSDFFESLPENERIEFFSDEYVMIENEPCRVTEILLTSRNEYGERKLVMLDERNLNKAFILSKHTCMSPIRDDNHDDVVEITAVNEDNGLTEIIRIESEEDFDLLRDEIVNNGSYYEYRKKTL